MHTRKQEALAHLVLIQASLSCSLVCRSIGTSWREPWETRLMRLERVVQYSFYPLSNSVASNCQ